MAGAATGNQPGGIYRLFATPCIPKPIGEAEQHFAKISGHGRAWSPLSFLPDHTA